MDIALQGPYGRRNLRRHAFAVVLLSVTALFPLVAHADQASDDYRAAVALYKQSRWELAADALGKFVQQHPKHDRVPFARLYRGLALVKVQKYADARDILRGFVRDYPKSENLPDAAYRVAECSYLLGDLKAAQTEFAEFLNDYPDHVLAEWALPYLGDAQLRLGDSQTAAATFERSLERYPTGRMADDSRFGLARASEAIGKTDRAAELYGQIASNAASPRAPQAQLKVATIYFDAQQYDKAAAAYEQLETQWPDSDLVPTARLNRGYALYRAGQFVPAAEQFAKLFDDKQHGTTARYWNGISNKGARDYASAATALRQSYDADPNGPLAQDSLHQLADSEMRRGNYADAQKLFLEVVEKWPRSELADDALYLAAESAHLAGDRVAADRLLDQFEAQHADSPLRMHEQLLRARVLATSDDPEQRRRASSLLESVIDKSELPRTRAMARLHLARLQESSGEHQKALATAGPLVEQVTNEGASSEFVDVLVLQGESLLALKRYDDAAKALGKYIELLPEGPLAATAHARRAAALAAAGQMEAARADLATLTTRFAASPQTPAALQQVADAAYAAEDWATAYAVFSELATHSPEPPYHPIALSGMAWALHQQNDNEKAAELFSQVLSAYPREPRLAPEAAFMQGKALQAAGKLEGAAAAYSAAFELFAPTEPAREGDEDAGPSYYAFRGGLQAARALSLAGKVDEADAAYEKLLTRFPKPRGLDKVLDEWALINYEAQRFARSDEIFRRLVEQAPQSELVDNARLSLAESDLLADRFAEAKKAFAALKNDPKSEDLVREVALHQLVVIAVREKAWPEVSTTASELLERYPASDHARVARLHLAEANLHLGELDKARTALEELHAARDVPEVGQADWFPRVWVLLSEVYWRLKEYDHVTVLVEEFRGARPDSPVLYQAYEVLGRSYKQQAKFDRAREAFTIAINHPSGNGTETAAKSQLMIAETCFLQQDYKQALPEYLKVYSLYQFPEWQAPALFQAAVCDEHLDQWASAVQSYETLIKEFPKSEHAAKAQDRLEAARKRASL